MPWYGLTSYLIGSCHRIPSVDVKSVTWFCILVKQITPVHPFYQWHELFFHTRWTPHSNSVLCFDIPRPIQAKIEERVSSLDSTDLPNLYALHVPVIEEVIQLYNDSVWALRDEIRRVEKVI